MPSDTSVDEALDRATGPRRGEVTELLELFEHVAQRPPVVWAERIVGFGQYAYAYDSGREGIAPEIAFASGSKHTLYLVEGFAERWPDLLERLGPHRTSSACLYLTRLSAVDQDVLRELLDRSLAVIRDVHGAGK
ncbi:hypothetical protein NS234_19280 [Microbacterium oxydans]|uniref:DUF1801 domain-containing protein n=1 Tax=Microbacterium oxydans TaxID=82380 RepID=UPI000734C86C|nr:DUF1801 domain-containing protein [Microbacterium oxydans]KTR74312.1 hypothetical protein NS234_19280 [Microbacterium oxydans]